MIRRDNKGELLIYISIVFIGLVCMVGLYLDMKYNPHPMQRMDVEYHLEIINQDSVAIRNVDTDRTYKVHIDSIQATLLEDNL